MANPEIYTSDLGPVYRQAIHPTEVSFLQKIYNSMMLLLA
jgi:hypothetical protein